MSEKICGECKYCHRGIFTFICNISPIIYVNYNNDACEEYEKRRLGF